MAKQKKLTSGGGVAQVNDYRHKQAKRKNKPPAKIAAEGTLPVIPKATYAYNPHLPPVLRFDDRGSPDKLPALLEKATREKLTANEARVLAEALRNQEPWLEWSGKREAKRFDVGGKVGELRISKGAIVWVPDDKQIWLPDRMADVRRVDARMRKEA